MLSEKFQAPLNDNGSLQFLSIGFHTSHYFRQVQMTFKTRYFNHIK